MQHLGLQGCTAADPDSLVCVCVRNKRSKKGIQNTIVINGATGDVEISNL